MRTAICILVLLALTAVAMAQKKTDKGITSRSVCTVSGDPHWRTFDGVRTDPQGTGVYTMAENNFFHVQCRSHRCNKRARRPVTCLSWCSIGIKDKGQVACAAAWGSRRGQPEFPPVPEENPTFKRQPAFSSIKEPLQLMLPNYVKPPKTCTEDKDNKGMFLCPNDVGQDMYFCDGWRLNFNGNRLQIWEVDDKGYEILNGNNFVYRRHYLRLYASNTPANREGADGVCGWWDNDPTYEFIDKAEWGKKYAESRKNARVNGKAIQEWYRGHGIDDNAKLVMPLRHPHTHEIMDLELPETPDDDQISMTQEIDFRNDEQFQEIKALCQELTAANPDDAFALDSCIIDGSLMSEDGVITDSAKDMMASASFAAEDTIASNVSQSSSDDDGLSAGMVAGIVACTVAGVALIVAGVMFYRLRKTNQSLSQFDVNSPARAAISGADNTSTSSRANLAI